MKITILILSLFFLLSCSSETSKKKSLLRKEDINKKELLLKKYQPIQINDSTKNYSYVLQERLAVPNKFVSMEADVTDVLVIDSIYYIDITSDIKGKLFFARVKVPTDLIENIKESFVYQEYKHQKGMFILKVNKVVSKNFRIEEFYDDEYGTETYIYFTDISNKPVIMTSELIDFYVYRF